MIPSSAQQKLDELSKRVLTASPETLKKEKCPDCGCGLHISFYSGGRGSGAVAIDCRPCKIRIRLDGVPDVPPWVSIVGGEIQT